MPKINISDITQELNNALDINLRFQQVEDEFNNNVLYRNNPVGFPNTMNNDLDMAGNSILNVNLIDPNFEILASNIIISPPFPQLGVTIQDALEIFAAQVVPTAADLSFIPTGGISATTIQGAIEELDAEKAPIGGDGSDLTAGNITVTGLVDGRDIAADGIVIDSLVAGGATTARLISVIPTGTITSINVQDALAELDGDITSLVPLDIGFDFAGEITGNNLQEALQSVSDLFSAVDLKSDTNTMLIADLGGPSNGNSNVNFSTGDLTVTGDVIVSGTVNGRDVALDGLVLDNLNSAGVGQFSENHVGTVQLRGSTATQPFYFSNTGSELSIGDLQLTQGSFLLNPAGPTLTGALTLDVVAQYEAGTLGMIYPDRDLNLAGNPHIYLIRDGNVSSRFSIMYVSPTGLGVPLTAIDANTTLGLGCTYQIMGRRVLT